MARYYQAEYAAETPTQKAKRASRNRAQYQYVKTGMVFVGDGKDVDHRNSNALDNKSGNLSIMAMAKNLAKKRK